MATMAVVMLGVLLDVIAVADASTVRARSDLPLLFPDRIPSRHHAGAGRTSADRSA
jgi:hypothetical protein